MSQRPFVRKSCTTTDAGEARAVGAAFTVDAAQVMGWGGRKLPIPFQRHTSTTALLGKICS